MQEHLKKGFDDLARKMDEAIMKAMGLTRDQVETMSREELKRRVHAFNYGGTQTGRFSSQAEQPKPQREVKMPDENIPKHELLLKILKMTTSDNDATALVAIRKANKLLDDAGWTWDKLLAGKIKVVGDPFAQVTRPPTRQYAPEPQPYQPPPKPRYSAPPPPPPPKTYSDRFNSYSGHCHQCGTFVKSHEGYIVQPPTGRSNWVCLCGPCNKATHIPLRTTPAKRQRADVSQL